MKIWLNLGVMHCQSMHDKRDSIMAKGKGGDLPVETINAALTASLLGRMHGGSAKTP